MTSQASSPTDIVAVVSDVDGTLVQSDKSLSSKTIEVVAALRNAGLKFAIVSSRPPRGLKAVIDRLHIEAPIAGFNGGAVTSPDLAVIDSHPIGPAVTRRVVAAIEECGADAWLFSGQEWFVCDPEGTYVALEKKTVGFEPTVVDDFVKVADAALKIVAVSDNFSRLEELQAKMREPLSKNANVVRSQDYYLDFTHPRANKGDALLAMARLMGASPANTVVIGDGENDIPMFRQAGLSIAMGNAVAKVQESANFVTGSNDADGFAAAMQRFVLGGQRTEIR